MRAQLFLLTSASLRRNHKCLVGSPESRGHGSLSVLSRTSWSSSASLPPPSSSSSSSSLLRFLFPSQCQARISSFGGHLKGSSIGPLARLQHAAVSEVLEPLLKAGEGNFKGRVSLKRALCVALQNHLVVKKGVQATEAASIVTNAPGFVKKLIARAKDEGSLMHNFSIAVKPEKNRKPGDDSLPTFQLQVEAFLENEDINEIEVYFETLGLSDFSVLEGVVAAEKPQLVGEDGLLASTELLQSLGIPRKRVWRLYERDRKLLKCTHADLNASLRVLESLGVQKKALPALIQACPLVLRIDLEETMREVLKYMDDVGIEKNFVGRLLQYNPQEVLRARDTHFGEKMQVLLDCGLSKDRVIRILREFPQLLTLSLEHHVKPNIEFLCSLGLKKEQVGKVVGGSPQILSYSIKKNFLPKIAFLESLGVMRSNVGLIVVKFPGIFGHSIEESMLPKVKFLESLGVERRNIGKIITIFPAIWGYSIEENLIPKMKFFESLGMERASLGRVVTRAPSILGLSVEQNLKPKVAFFEENGVKGKELARLFMSRPSVIGRAIDGSLSSKLKFLASLGLEPKSIAMARALIACAAQSVGSLEVKCSNLIRVGFSPEAVLTIVTQQPTVLHLSDDRILSKVKYYTEKVGLSIDEVAKSPPLLSYSLENRIKPRHNFVSWLRSTGLLTRQYPITTIVSISESSFLKKFVDPYPQGAVKYRSLLAAGDVPSSVSSDSTNLLKAG